MIERQEKEIGSRKTRCENFVTETKVNKRRDAVKVTSESIHFGADWI